MKTISFDYAKTSIVTNDELRAVGKELQAEIERVIAAREQEYETDYSSIHCPFDTDLIKQVQHIAEEKKTLKPTTLIVIGIGGSNLGTIAVYEAVYGLFYNEQQPDIKVYFADTVDSDYIYDIILLVEQEVEQGRNVIINVVSKSGTTTETIANFEIFLHLLKAYKKDYNNYVVVTTDEGSKLWKLAQEQHFTCIPVAQKIGGRYSVFSPVGLFPLAMLGIDIDELCAGARSIFTQCIDRDVFHNIAGISASCSYIHYQNGINIHDTFVFSKDLKSIGDWYRQLMGESIGKELNRKGEKVNIGITPTVSVGSTDLHSVTQLYLGGPYDKFTTFISVEKNKSNISLPKFDKFETLVAKIQGKPLAVIMDAILQGVKAAYQKNKRPFVSIILPEKSSFYIGQLLQFKMVEMIYLGYLLEVNPFDQPNVELYKKETREILKHE